MCSILIIRFARVCVKAADFRDVIKKINKYFLCENRDVNPNNSHRSY